MGEQRHAPSLQSQPCPDHDPQEWRQQLRSSLHPLLFAAVYRIVDALSAAAHLSPSWRAEVLVAAPKLVQAVFAAMIDYYTIRLAQRAYGKEARLPCTALTLLSPWQFFCSTRTLSNSIETALTAAGLFYFPMDRRTTDMAVAFGLAAIATILRPTNALIWMIVVASAWLQSRSWRYISRTVVVATVVG